MYEFNRYKCVASFAEFNLFIIVKIVGERVKERERERKKANEKGNDKLRFEEEKSYSTRGMRYYTVKCKEGLEIGKGKIMKHRSDIGSRNEITSLNLNLIIRLVQS